MIQSKNSTESLNGSTCTTTVDGWPSQRMKWRRSCTCCWMVAELHRGPQESAVIRFSYFFPSRADCLLACAADTWPTLQSPGHSSVPTNSLLPLDPQPTQSHQLIFRSLLHVGEGIKKEQGNRYKDDLLKHKNKNKSKFLVLLIYSWLSMWGNIDTPGPACSPAIDVVYEYSL